MVMSTNRSTAYHSRQTLEAWIRARCQSLRQEYQTLFEVDFQAMREEIPYTHALLVMVDQILEKAAFLSGADSKIEIAGFLTHRGLEIEVSSDRELGEDGFKGAFQREATSVHNGYTLTSYRARCPQGGTAWIVVQSRFQRLRMVA
jgi:hypothetical protein